MTKPMDPSSSPSLDTCRITVVYDNHPYREGLDTAWGFGCLIRGAEKLILFDTGRDDPYLLGNMEKLGIDPNEVEIVVLSHIHRDHVGGLGRFLERNPGVTVYFPASFPKSFRESVKKSGAKTVPVKEPLEICPGVFSTGEMGFRIKEQGLVLKTKKGLLVITGCAHPGVFKMVKRAGEHFGENVHFVLGGFHLLATPGFRVKGIVKSFRKAGVRYVGPCHCSGDKAIGIFEKEYQERFLKVGVGREITLENLP